MASTRLTKSLRQSILRALMDDIPTTDYRKQAENLVQDYIYKTLPPKVKAVYDDPTLRCYLANKHAYGHNVPNFASSRYYTGLADQRLPDDVAQQVRDLAKKHTAQLTANNDVRDKVAAVLEATKTVAKAVELMPELEPYVPATTAAALNVPAPANIVADLVELGWPKNKQRKKAA